MDKELQNAIEQMKNGEETGLNYIFTQTYNFVYLRAKTILSREDDICQLMKEVYLQMVTRAYKLNEGNLYEWLGKQTYRLGCEKFRKKKVREAEFIDLSENEYAAPKTVDQESTCEIMDGVLEQLPDMYQATFYAFYYDYMKIEDIAKVMGYSEGVILNRLNYIHKYMQKALADYQADTKARVQFSLEAACVTTRTWSLNNCMSEVVAGSVYLNICKQLKHIAGAIELEDGQVAGADKTIVPHEEDDLEPIKAQLSAYRSKPGIHKKQIALVIVIALAFVALILGIVLFVGKADKDGQKQEQSAGQEQNGPDADDVDIEDETVQEDEVDEESTDAEYILPNSDTEELTRADLEGLTKEQLRLARNEIYARYGMIFGVEDLDTYFSAKSWYQPRVEFGDFYDTVEMSLIEEANVSLIQKVEKELE